MTVKELMKKLAKMDPEMKVCFPDTYEQNEGWGQYPEYCIVGGAEVEDGRVMLWAGEDTAREEKDNDEIE